MVWSWWENSDWISESEMKESFVFLVGVVEPLREWKKPWHGGGKMERRRGRSEMTPMMKARKRRKEKNNARQQQEEDKKRNSDDSLVALAFDFIKKTIEGLISIWWLDRNPEAEEGGKTVVGGFNPKHFKGNHTYVPVTGRMVY
ncbi:hypothetical protein SADUNF_Sadunf13G0002300 [Salix dunnii]|uniref:Uncharacterized protein n=1 Tax=Salix dunnii TaxID=1413687 RepID=A0A835MKE1_9ROSI|nr:hypothetical protein SADUNF_Sadunf13G0002300 [Salix dunnii]